MSPCRAFGIATVLVVAALLTARMVKPLLDAGALPGAIGGCLRLDGRISDTRAAAVLGAQRLPSNYVDWLDREAATAATGLALPSGGWWFGGGGWLEPASYASMLLAACERPDSSKARSGPESTGAAEKQAAAPVSLPEKISFNQHVQPILSEYCYHCHGPDSGTREPKKAPLRLDRVADAFAIRDDGRPVIIKGKPMESALIKHIISADPDEVMPPPKSHKFLKAGEIALLKRWVEQGAEYEIGRAHV